MSLRDLQVDEADLRHGSGDWGRPGARILLVLLISLGLMLVLPAHAAARCFGVPEATGADPAWSLGLRVESAHGLWNLVTLGVDERATDVFDADFDVIEPVFERGLDPREDTIGLYAYFYYPENPASAAGSPDAAATVALTRSVIHLRDAVTWPLRVAYFFPSELVLTLYWTPEAVNRSNFEIDIMTPSGEEIAMENASSLSFLATPGFYDFTLSARVKVSLVPQGDLLLLVAALAAYSVVVVIFLWLRRVRKRSASQPEKRARR